MAEGPLVHTCGLKYSSSSSMKEAITFEEFILVQESKGTARLLLDNELLQRKSIRDVGRCLGSLFKLSIARGPMQMT